MKLELADGVSLADTEYGVVLLDECAGRYWSLNPSGALVLRTLLDGGSPAEAAGAVVARYEVDVATVNADIEELLTALRSTGMVRTGVTP